MCKAQHDAEKLTDGHRPDLINFALHTKMPDAPADDRPDVKVGDLVEEDTGFSCWLYNITCMCAFCCDGIR